VRLALRVWGAAALVAGACLPFVGASAAHAQTVPGGAPPVKVSMKSFAFSPAFVSAATASVDDLSTTDGMTARGRPVETQIVTVLPFGWRRPAAGVCLNTRPACVCREAW